MREAARLLDSISYPKIEKLEPTSKHLSKLVAHKAETNVIILEGYKMPIGCGVHDATQEGHCESKQNGSASINEDQSGGLRRSMIFRTLARSGLTRARTPAECLWSSNSPDFDLSHSCAIRILANHCAIKSNTFCVGSWLTRNLTRRFTGDFLHPFDLLNS